MKKASKPMSNAEKKARAQWRKDMREKGVLPPVKKPLNRKRFIKEAQAEYNNGTFDVLLRVGEAMGVMLATYGRQPTLEQVGVAKVMKLAVTIQRFHEKCKSEGKETYKISDLFDLIKPIIDA